jgi:4'-phosphopantetheinyl transferase
MLLSHYVGIPTTQLHFETQAQGKPTLMTPSSIPIQFNVTHTQGMALIALTLQYAVGIDVEWIDRKIHDGDIATRYFSAQESTYLASLPPSERTHRFFGYWTCKEAYLKMLGKGIAGGLAQCELLIDPDRCQVGILRQKQQDQEGACSLFQMRAGDEHVGAVAIACSAPQISYWNWQDECLP